MTVQGSKKVLVVGSMGPIGDAVVSSLLSDGHVVRTVGLSPGKAGKSLGKTAYRKAGAGGGDLTSDDLDKSHGHKSGGVFERTPDPENWKASEEEAVKETAKSGEVVIDPDKSTYKVGDYKETGSYMGEHMHFISGPTGEGYTGKTVAPKGPDVDVCEGNWWNPDDLGKALDGVDGVCLIGSPVYEDPGKEAEYGKMAVDSCKSKGIGHVVYISACCSDKNSGVPNFEAKHAVEEHLKRCGLSYTILRPAFVMEDLASDWCYSRERGVLHMPLRPDRTLGMISAADVGKVAATAFTVPDKLTEREIDLAADRMTMEEIAEAICRATSTQVTYAQGPVKGLGRHSDVMFEFLDKHGFTGDIESAGNLLKRFEIPLTSFRGHLDGFRESYRKAA